LGAGGSSEPPEPGVGVDITVGVGITLPSVTGLLVKVGSAVSVVSIVLSVLVGDVLEVLLSGEV